MAISFSQSFKLQAVEKALSRQDDVQLKDVAKSLAYWLFDFTKWIRQSKNQQLDPALDGGATMLATLQKLGLFHHSVRNDNPYSESLFRTLQYRPEYPEKAFDSLAIAREWVDGFVDWYNHEHRHSSIKYVTPVERYMGQD